MGDNSHVRIRIYKKAILYYGLYHRNLPLSVGKACLFVWGDYVHSPFNKSAVYTDSELIDGREVRM